MELETRLELPEEHEYYDGIPTTMSIDSSLHSLFGASKAAADLLVQEYGRYFDMPTACFRGGCLTGPNHAGARLHGFLSYLMRCTVTGEPYTVYGYGGKQVRDNIHSADLVRAFEAFHASPRARRGLQHRRRARQQLLDARGDRALRADRGPRARLGARATTAIGDHRWWISDLAPFRRDYPGWELEYGVEEILREIYEQNVEAWRPTPVKISIVIPAHNEAGSIGRRWPASRGARRRGHRLRDARRRRREHRRDGSSDRRGRVTRTRVRCIARTTRRASASRSAPGSRSSTGDAVAIVMADGSDEPGGRRRATTRVLEEGYDCAFGSRFVRGVAVETTRSQAGR